MNKEEQKVEEKVSEETAEEVKDSVTEPVQEETPAEETVPKSKWDEAVAAAEEFKRKWYLTTAEYDNYRKRTATTRQTAYADGKSDVVKKILPIGDNLERALAMVSDEKTKQGLEMVLKSFQKTLADEGIAEINPVNQPFDTNDMEAIMAVEPAEGEESGTVKQVYLKGYRNGDKVIRYAQVVVVK